MARPIVREVVMRQLALALFLGAVAAPTGAEETIRWRADLEAARADAKRTGRPMLIVFR
ncbi:MAG: hypothetical protein ACYTG3_14990 [Planctomycetota bacterium]|jgi:hypothetical protein